MTRPRSSTLYQFPPVAAMCCLLFAGCNDRGGATTTTVPTETAERSERMETGRRLLHSGYEMLNNLDDFAEDSREGVESAMNQMVRRLNEGLAMVAGDGADAPQLDAATDGRMLREIVWLRDAARFAVGDATDPRERARRLFDWTSRNIRLLPDDDPEADTPLAPWGILLLGRGTAFERAWLFQLLARQEGLPVVLLLRPGEADQINERFWCAALVADAEKNDTAAKLYLFDTRWGTPIPGRNGQGVAALADVVADSALLRALDLDAEHPYPIDEARIQRLTAWIDASSPYVEPRFARLGRHLTGNQRVILSVDFAELRSKLSGVPRIDQIEQSRLRDQRVAMAAEPANEEELRKIMAPFVVRDPDPASRLRQPPLWKARVRHVAGRYFDDRPESSADRQSSISRLYQESRPDDARLETYRKLLVEQKLTPENLEFVVEKFRLTRRMATYWLGLVAYDLGNFDTAEFYLNLVLQDPEADAFVAAARYNLGRTYEAMSEAETTGQDRRNALRKKAIDTYRSTILKQPPDVQSLFRARTVAAK